MQMWAVGLPKLVNGRFCGVWGVELGIGTSRNAGENTYLQFIKINLTECDLSMKKTSEMLLMYDRRVNPIFPLESKNKTRNHLAADVSFHLDSAN